MMGKLRNDEKGFGAVEVVLVFVIAVLIGVVGFMVYKNHSKAKPAPIASNTITKQTTTTPALANPYAGWKSYTLSQEKLTFQYPSDWTIKVTPQDSADGIVDNVSLAGSNNFGLSIADGGLSPGYCPMGGCNVLQSDTVTFLGQTGYLDAWDGNVSGDSFLGINLSQSRTDATPNSAFPTTNIASGHLIISLGWATASSPNPPLHTLVDNAQYAEAKLVIASMHY